MRRAAPSRREYMLQMTSQCSWFLQPTLALYAYCSSPTNGMHKMLREAGELEEIKEVQ